MQMPFRSSTFKLKYPQTIIITIFIQVAHFTKVVFCEALSDRLKREVVFNLETVKTEKQISVKEI